MTEGQYYSQYGKLSTKKELIRTLSGIYFKSTLPYNMEIIYV